jgi:large subunit ribosomal protein L32e
MDYTFTNVTREWNKMVVRKTSLTRKALQVRKLAKNKKPEFARSESWRYSKLSSSWRRPRGLDHKMRRKIKGWPPMVSTGYKGPKIARGLHPSGYREVIVHNVPEVEGLDPKTQAARIAHTVGRKKRGQIIAEARKKKIAVLNAKEVKEETATPDVSSEATEEKEQTKKKAEKPKRKAAKTKKEAKPATVSEIKAEKPKQTRKSSKPSKGAEKQ